MRESVRLCACTCTPSCTHISALNALTMLHPRPHIPLTGSILLLRGEQHTKVAIFMQMPLDVCFAIRRGAVHRAALFATIIMTWRRALFRDGVRTASMEPLLNQNWCARARVCLMGYFAWLGFAVSGAAHYYCALPNFPAHASAETDVDWMFAVLVWKQRSAHFFIW